MGFQNILCFVFILVFSITTAENPKRGFILTTAPNIISGSSHKACITVHHVTGKAHVELILKDSRENKPHISVSTKEWDYGVEDSLDAKCLDLEIPSSISASTAILNLKITFDSHPDYQIDASKNVNILQNVDPQLVFIESDLQVYKPNDVVKVRVLILTGSDFKPVLDPIKKIVIENPSGIKIAQWLNVSTDTGLAQIELPLSSEPKIGVWKIVVDQFNSANSVVDTFEVREYVLPRFKVQIEGPSRILLQAVKDGNATYKICGKYSYGKPVQGTVRVFVEPVIGFGYRRFYPEPRNTYIFPETELPSQSIQTDKAGCISFTHQDSENNALTSFKIKATLQEDGTEKTEDAIFETTVENQERVVMEFIGIKHNDYAKPGLIYRKQMKVYTQHNNQPLANVRVNICMTSCVRYYTDENGLFVFDFMINEDNYPDNGTYIDKGPSYTLIARTEGLETEGYNKLVIKPWHSPSGSYLNIVPPDGNEPLKCGGTYTFLLEYKGFTVEPKEFHYIIQSRNKIIAQSKVKPSSLVSQLNAYYVHDRIIQSKEVSGQSSSLYISFVKIDIPITIEMSSESTLLAYHVTDEGETVSASIKLKVEKCFNNEVTQSWSADTPYPGETVNLRISTSPNSLCAISSVDETTKYLKLSKGNEHQDGTSVTAQRVYKKLENSGLFKSTANNGDPKYCDSKIQQYDENNFYTTGRKYDEDALRAFDDANLLVLSDFEIETHNCVQLNLTRYEPLVLHMQPMARNGGPLLRTVGSSGPSNRPKPTETVRDNFPDSWLWELIRVGSDGELDVPKVVPDTITNWITSAYCISPEKGLGVTANPISNLIAFQPFFVEYTPPYSVKRGEIVHQKVQIFNYMPDSIPVSVSVESAEGLTVTLKNGQKKESVCIPLNEAAIIPITITGENLGKLNLTITASIDVNYPTKCGPPEIIYRSDTLIKPVFVKPEGLPIEISKSTLVCPSDFPSDAVVSWDFSLPEDVIPDSARAIVSVSGDLLGQALENLDGLVRLPMGCGEQNMILFVPNLHVLHYMNAVRLSKPKLKEDAIKNMKIGYERELNYRHRDGSFSAFGNSDTEGSTWLTAFVLKSFSEAKEFIFIDDQYLQQSQNWLTSKQHENGCFQSVGRVVHKEMTGGLSGSSVGLTAFVLVSLLKSPLPIDDFVTRNAKLCISRATSELDDYTLSLVTYAYTLLDKDSVEAKNSLEKLLQKVHVNDGIYWWGSEGSSSALKIEITSYVVLSLLKQGGSENMAKALGAVRWLSKHRNPRGGFESTQDTVLALEALSLYAEVSSRNPVDLTLGIKVGDTTSTIALKKENSAILQTLTIKELPNVIRIEASGGGCGMVQGSLRYNIHTPKVSDAFGLNVEALEGPSLKICAWYLLADGASNMAVIEVEMVTGYEPDRQSLSELQKSKVIKRFDSQSDKVILYLDQLQAEQTCVKFDLKTTNAIVVNPKPSQVEVYDYYSPDLKVSAKYLLPGVVLGPRGDP